MGRRYALLLPPSEGKAAGGSGPPWSADGPWDGPRRVVAAELARSMTRPATAARVCHVGGVALEAARTANRSLTTAPTMAAIDRYTGVLFDALAYRRQPASVQRAIRSHTLIFSGLWGLLTPDDPIPDYKLAMGSRLGRLGSLAGWWRPRLNDRLEARLRGCVVWDLLPGAHAAAWAPTACRVTDRVTVRVEEERAGRRIVVSHANKQVKGALAAFLAAGAGGDPRSLVDFVGPGGYRLDRTRSSLDHRGGSAVLSRSR